jgi:hypothetical protein
MDKLISSIIRLFLKFHINQEELILGLEKRVREIETDLALEVTTFNGFEYNEDTLNTNIIRTLTDLLLLLIVRECDIDKSCEIFAEELNKISLETHSFRRGRFLKNSKDDYPNITGGIL